MGLSWTQNTNATGYLLERSLNGVIWSTLSPAPAGSDDTYTDTTVSGGTTYEYRLSAINASGTSVPCAVATVLTNPESPVISGLTASDAEVDLSWTPVLSATGYTLQVSPNGTSNWTNASIQPTGTNTQLVVTGLTADTGYFFNVIANNATGASAASNVLSISTIADAPTNFAATATASSATLTWTAVAHATGYVIEQSTDGTNWTTLNTSALTGTSATFTDNTVSPGVAYQYRISTITAVGTSDPGTSVSVTTPLNAATGLTATVNSSSQITLNWNLDTDTGLTGYRLEVSADGTTGWTTVATTGTTVNAAVDSGLTASTGYYYRLFALSAGGDSLPTAVVSATTTS